MTRSVDVEAGAAPRPHPPRFRRRSLATAAGRAWAMFGPFLSLILVTLLFAWLTRETGSFVTAYNWRTIGVQTVITATAALGMTIVVISGGIDLSVGSSVALVTVVCAVLIRDAGISSTSALAIGLGVGTLCGLLNGALVVGLRVVPFIITLGSMKIFRGLAKWLSSSTSVDIPVGTRAEWMTEVLAIEPKSGAVVAPGIWMLLGLSVLLALGLRYTVFGRHVYAIGSNQATAKVCGVGVGRTKLWIYGLAGLATGLAGVLQFLYLNGTGDPTTADGLELQVIAAVVIGGGSLAGGEGSVLGTLIGCLFMSILNNGCVHAGISNASQDVIIGAIIVAAVSLDRLRRSSAHSGED